MILRPLYCDQLSLSLSSLQDIQKDRDVILLAETQDEATYVKHHQQKLIFQFSSMRHFAQELEEKGYRVRYTYFDDESNTHSMAGEIKRAIADLNPQEVILTWPGEYRQLQDMLALEREVDLPLIIREDSRFFISPKAFDEWAHSQRGLLMENFYRHMRQRTDLLMDGKKPVGGQWNYDKDNRKSLPKGIRITPPPQFEPDMVTQDVIRLVEREFSDHFGRATPFLWGVTTKEAHSALDFFITHHLPHFGDYQDAMQEGEPFLYHSVISPYLNAGLLVARDVCERAQEAFAKGHAPLNAVEGFIRQILGWREFIRGIYWREMPGYTKSNKLLAQRSLPELYWTGDTRMNCLKQVITMTSETAYSHHIQRLMVTGNFALLAGLNPLEVHEWYLIVYADAYEWVEAPNTIGMALHADGGIVGTKPYISSGAYINRMSNFCKNCHYNVKNKTEEDACPFNSLYWHFLDRHRERFENNGRMGIAYKNLDRMDEEQRKNIIKRGDDVLEQMKKGEL